MKARMFLDLFIVLRYLSFMWVWSNLHMLLLPTRQSALIALFSWPHQYPATHWPPWPHTPWHTAPSSSFSSPLHCFLYHFATDFTYALASWCLFVINYSSTLPRNCKNSTITSPSLPIAVVYNTATLPKYKYNPTSWAFFTIIFKLTLIIYLQSNLTFVDSTQSLNCWTACASQF